MEILKPGAWPYVISSGGGTGCTFPFGWEDPSAKSGDGGTAIIEPIDTAT